MGPYHLIYDTVGLYPLIFFHSEYQPRHLLYTNYAASVPPLLTQWDHTCSFYVTVGLYPLIYLHSWHHPHHLFCKNCAASVPPLLTQWAHTSTYTVGTTLAIYFTQTVQTYSPPNLHNGPIPSYFMTQWAYTPSLTYTVGTTLAIYFAKTVQPQFLPYLHSGLIPPHL